MSKSQIQGTVPAGRVRKVQTSEPGRVCEVKGCTTILTRYNLDPTCYQHTAPKKARTRGRKSEEVDEMMVDANKRCYPCTLRIGGWGQPAQEVQDPDTGIFHWWVRSGTARLCSIR